MRFNYNTESKIVHFCHILVCYLWKRKNATQASKNLNHVYGDEALQEKQCGSWFDKFSSDYFSLKVEPRSVKLNEVEDDKTKP